MAVNNIPVGIVTTVTRTEYLAATREALDDSTVHEYCDLEQGLTRNHLAAWEELFDSDPAAGHALLLQDDLIAVKNWRAAVAALIERLPEAPAISFYTGRKEVTAPRALERGYARLKGKLWLNEQALSLRRDVWDDYLSYVSSGEYRSVVSEVDAWKHHDVLLRGFFALRGHDVLLVAPPLFQHVGVESSVGHPWKVFGRTRQAASFPGGDFDAAEHFTQLRARS